MPPWRGLRVRVCDRHICILQAFSQTIRQEYHIHKDVSGGNIPDSKVHWANMGPAWVLLAPDRPHVGPMNLAIRDILPKDATLSMLSHLSLLTHPWLIRCVILSWEDRSSSHVMMTSSNGNIFRVTGPLCGNSPVTGEFPAQRPVRRGFYVFLSSVPK